MVKFTSERDHFCGKCHKVIKAGTEHLYQYEEYQTPNKQWHGRYYPVHIECLEKSDGRRE